MSILDRYNNKREAQLEDVMMTALQQISQQIEAIKGEAGSIYAVGDQGETSMGFQQELDAALKQLGGTVRNLQNLKMKQQQEEAGAAVPGGEVI